MPLTGGNREFGRNEVEKRRKAGKEQRIPKEQDMDNYKENQCPWQKDEAGARYKAKIGGRGAAQAGYSTMYQCTTPIISGNTF